jgi:hypothetical protein
MEDVDSFEILVSSCGLYSDLWDSFFFFLGKNWPEHPHVVLLTDEPSDKTFPNVEICAAPKGMEFSKRLFFGLSRIRSKFVLFLLDDFFITKRVDEKSLFFCFSKLVKSNGDYLRLYHYPNVKKKRLSRGWFSFMPVYPYDVNVHPFIAKTSFLRRASEGPDQKIAYFEGAFSKKAIALGANCFYSTGKLLTFSEGVIHGMFFRKAYKMVVSQGLYNGHRQPISRWNQFCYSTSFLIKSHMPPSFRNLIKTMYKGAARRKGKTFFSD